MTFDEMIQTGWQKHDSETPKVAELLQTGAELVDDAAQAARYTSLLNHTIGQHLGDWPLAARLTRQALGRLDQVARPSDPGSIGRDSALPGKRLPADGPQAATAARAEALSPDLATTLCNDALAQYLAGNTAAAMLSELRAAGQYPARAFGDGLLRIRFLAADALAGCRRWDDCTALLSAALDLTERLPEASSLDRAIASATSNVVSALLEVAGRTPAQNALLERGALAARRHWLRAGDWTNNERSDYLIALTYNALARYGEALAAAERGLATIAANGDEPVDAAFLHLAAARAHKGLGRRDGQAEALAAAQRLATGFDEGTTRWFAGELAKAQ